MAVPTTVDEFEEALLAFKTKDPNKNGKADEPEFKEATAYFHKLYKQGLIDPESFTQERTVLFEASLEWNWGAIGITMEEMADGTSRSGAGKVSGW